MDQTNQQVSTVLQTKSVPSQQNESAQKPGFTPKRIVGNTVWIIAKTVYSTLLAFIVGLISARYLGPENYGLIGYGAAYINIFLAISRFGLNHFIINDVVKHPDEADSIIGSAVLFRLLLSVLSVASIYVIMVVLEPDSQLTRLIVLFQSLSIIFDVHEVFEYWFKAKMLAKYVSIASICGYTVMCAWKIILLAMKAPVLMFALSASIEAAIILLIVAVCFFYQSKVKLRISKEKIVSFFHRGKHMVITAIGVSLYLQMDRIMLKKMLGDSTAVGYYTVALAVATMWEFIPNAIIETATPIIIKNKTNSEEKYIHSFQALLCLITVMAVVVGVGFVLLGGIFVRLAYGEQYIGAITPMNILIWSTGFAMIGTARGVWLIQEKKYTPDMMMTKEFTDQGIILSGGAYQKLALARSFVRDTPIKIFDEPTSALDPLSEDKIFKNIYYNTDQSIAIVISHRLSSIHDVDIIYVLSDGRICEHGRHRELMKKNGVYADLYRKQAEGYIYE